MMQFFGIFVKLTLASTSGAFPLSESTESVFPATVNLENGTPGPDVSFYWVSHPNRATTTLSRCVAEAVSQTPPNHPKLRGLE